MQLLFAAAIVSLGTLIPFTSSSSVPTEHTLSHTAVPTTITPIIPVGPIATYLPPSAPTSAPVSKIFSYAGGGFENLALRSNGQILATIAFPESLLFYIDPLSIRPGIVLHNFTSLENLIGITEVAADVFYVAGKGRDGGPFAIFSVGMRDFVVLPNGTITTPPVIRKIGTIPTALALNGMTHLRGENNSILIADSLLGGIWRFHIDTGNSELIIKHPSMASPQNKTEFAAYGINGLRVQNSNLFYCNSGAQSIYKMPIRPDGSPNSEAMLITSNIACDDFAVDTWGYAYVASPRNAVIKLDLHIGAQIVVAGKFNETISSIVSASSVRFGVGDNDQTSVYVTTNGGAFVGAPPGSQGISRVDVGDLAPRSDGGKEEKKETQSS